jgi:K+-sensing histidine kinase KdpD
MNLIINARDAMPKGGTIAVTARNEQAGAANPLGLPAGDYVVLAVSDDGSGIPPRSSSRSPNPSSRPRRSARAPASACRWSTASPTSPAAAST